MGGGERGKIGCLQLLKDLSEVLGRITNVDFDANTGCM